jgi:hypothetical protein
VSSSEFNSSSGPGNFAKHLTEKLFPEFFTEECLHRFYSCNANGDKKNNKNQLDPSCIQPLKEYVRHFFPEVTQPQAWKLMVIPKINDALRRPRRHSSVKNSGNSFSVRCFAKLPGPEEELNSATRVESEILCWAGICWNLLSRSTKRVDVGCSSLVLEKDARR